MDGQNCAWTIIPAVTNLLNAGEHAGQKKLSDICAVDPENRVREIGAAIGRGMKCLTRMGSGTSLHFSTILQYIPRCDVKI